jgi:hypothetical protein
MAPPQLLRAQPEPLGHSGAHSLNEHIGAGGQLPRDLEPGDGLEVDRDAALPSGAGIAVEREAGQPGRAVGAVNPDHVRAEVRQQHGRLRDGPRRGQEDDAGSQQCWFLRRRLRRS